MPLSYSARLRRDLSDWQERGLIQPEQAERIAAHALAPRGLRHLQTAMALCVLLLVAPSVIAFVAANWSGMTPLSRLITLVLADAAAVVATYVAARRSARDRAVASRRLVDGLATLSLVIAAATLALVGQTFHVAADPRGYAGTVAALGLVTALIARSGGAAVLAALALVVADGGLGGFDFGLMQGEAAAGAGMWFWSVGPALFLASLSGWLPARKTTLLLLLIVATHHLGGVAAGPMVLLAPDRVLTVAALALTLGHVLSQPSLHGRWGLRLDDGGQALARAAVGLTLIGIVAIALRMLGFGGARPTVAVSVAFAALALAALIMARFRVALRMRVPTSDLLVLAAAAVALLVWLVAGSHRAPSTFWTVWGGIVPALMLVVAGDLEDRRELYGWGLALTAGLTIGMLAASRDLIAFSGNLLVCALLVTLALVACRRVSRRIEGRAA